MDGERTYMKFEKVVIKNFRNFDNVELDLSNKNIFFGLNDVGKTNFLYALRYVFDKDIRKQNLLDSDFHNKQLDKPIEIVVTIDISDVADSDCQKLRAQLKGALLSEHNKVYIKLFAEYSKTEMLALPILSWGGDINHLYEMKQRGYLYEIDYVFNVIYIDSYVDLYSLFKKNVSQLVRNEKDEDKDILAKIQNTVDDLNGHIASLSGIKEFEDKLTPEYQKFHDEGISVSIKSEIAVKGLYSNIIPYIKQDNDDNLYPTAGEGRKKLLAYSIYDILSDENAEKKINLFLIEEPENHLHKSMQIALSQILFTDSKYTYLFVTTHSPFVLYEMDNVNLVRIYSERKINSISTFYKVPDAYEKNRKMLNRCLSEAIFANKVLLVEGPSEYMLFAKYLIIEKYSAYDVISEIPVEGNESRKTVSTVKRLLKRIEETIDDEQSFGSCVTALAEYLGYDTRPDHINKLFKTISDTSFHVAFEANKYKHIAITFHSSKGLEFEQVIVFAEDYRLSDMSSIYNHYVAVTRAKSKLIIVKLNNYNANCFQNNLQKIFSESGHNIEDVVLF